MNTEINDSYDDYTDDTGVTEADGGASVSDRQGDATDAIAAMLVDGDTSHLDNFDGDSGDAFKMGHVRTGDGERESGEKAEDRSWREAADGNQSMPNMQSAGQRMQQIEQFAGNLSNQYAELEQQFANGEISQADFMYQRDFLQGRAAAATIQHQQAQLEQMQNAQWMESQVAAVREKHKDVFDHPGKREEYTKRGVAMLGNLGYSVEELHQIEAREFNFLIDHLKMEDRLNELELQNKMLIKEKKQRQQSLRRGQRDNEVGVRGTRSQSDQQDEVMRVLFGGK